MNDGENYFKLILADSSIKWLPLGNELIWTRAEVNRAKVLLVFDLYGCRIRLSDESRESLWNAHKEYCVSAFKKASSAVSEIGITILRFDVLPEDAPEWFRRIVTVFGDRNNLVNLGTGV